MLMRQRNPHMSQKSIERFLESPPETQVLVTVLSGCLFAKSVTVSPVDHLFIRVCFPVCLRLETMECILPNTRFQYTLHGHLSIVSLVNSGFECSRRDSSVGGLYRKIEFYPNSWIAFRDKPRCILRLL